MKQNNIAPNTFIFIKLKANCTIIIKTNIY